MQEALVVAVGVFLHRQASKARRLANEWLIELFPERFGPHEGLVVETRRQERRGKIGDRHQIEIERSAMVLAFRLKPIEKLGDRGARVGFLSRTRAELDKRVGFFRSGGQNAARAVILE